MNPIFFAFAAMLSWGIGDFLIQKSVKRIGNIETLAWIGIIGSLALLPFVWNDLHIIGQKPIFLVILILGIITFSAGVTQFAALKKGKLSVVEIILIIELPITILLGIIFLKESINYWQTLLIILLITGIGLISLRTRNKLLILLSKLLLIKINFFEIGIWLAGLAGIIIALENFLTAIVAKNASPLLAVWSPWVIFTLACIIYLTIKGRYRKFIKDSINDYRLILPTAIIDTLGWIFFALAVAQRELAITIAVTESYPAIALLLGVWLNKEKISAYQYWGAGLAISASFLIALL